MPLLPIAASRRATLASSMKSPMSPVSEKSSIEARKVALSTPLSLSGPSRRAPREHGAADAEAERVTFSAAQITVTLREP